mmetsp:Transcript_22673/g.56146  ORF Transcript_22673/g.56146 Transcript_22673/m.56146 type:complete len:209 (-) Transcript_22673:333-959(-)
MDTGRTRRNLLIVVELLSSSIVIGSPHLPIPSGFETLRLLRVTVVRGGGGGIISESSSEEVTAGLATSDTEEYGTVVCAFVATVVFVFVVPPKAASCSWVARKANASSPAELERGRRLPERRSVSATEASPCLSPQISLEPRPEDCLCCLKVAPPLPPMRDPTLPSTTEHGEIPSMALAASKRSSRFIDDVLLFLLLELQAPSPFRSC